MSTGSKIVVALLIFVIVVVGAGLLYLYSGAYNVAATDEHAGLVRWVLSTTQEQSVRAHADELDVTLPTDSTAIRAGYASYSAMCVMCHGAPGMERGWVGKGMRPEPPELPEGDHVAVEMLAVERDDGVLRRVPPHVAALDVHPEHDRVEGTRAGTHVPR